MNKQTIIKAVLKLTIMMVKRNPMLLRWFLREVIKSADLQTLAAVTFNIKDKLRGK